MNIIFGEDISELKEKFLLLELDTFRDGDTVRTAYCILDKPPLAELKLLNFYLDAHDQLIKNYRKQHWEYCLQVIDELCGRWGGELDTFYDDLKNRINNYQENAPGEDWDGIRPLPAKFAKESQPDPDQ